MKRIIIVLALQVLLCSFSHAEGSSWLEFMQLSQDSMVDEGFEMTQDFSEITVNRASSDTFQILSDIKVLANFLPPVSDIENVFSAQDESGVYYHELILHTEKSFGYLTQNAMLFAVFQIDHANSILKLSVISNGELFLEYSIGFRSSNGQTLLEVTTQRLSSQTETFSTEPNLKLGSLKLYLEDGLDLTSLGCTDNRTFCF